MLVDPDPVRRIALLRALRRKGWTVLHVADVRSAEAFARESSSEIGVLVAPVESGSECGMELARRVTRFHPGVRVLLVCRQGFDSEQWMRAFEGGYEAIAGPGSVEELVRRIAATASNEGASPTAPGE